MRDPAVVTRAWLEGLGVDVTGQPSVKLTAGSIVTDRHLDAVKTKVLPDVADAISDLLDALRAPAAASEFLLPRSADADFVHAGHERTPSGDLVAKVYLEYRTRLARAERDGSVGQVVVHDAVKWAPGSGTCTVDSYATEVGWDAAGVADRIVAVLADVAPGLADSVLGLRRVARDDWTDGGGLLTVTRPDSTRRSVDVRLSSGGATVADLEPEIRSWADVTDVRVTEVDELLDLHGSERVMRIAAGVDRRGGPFVTLYLDAPAGP